MEPKICATCTLIVGQSACVQLSKGQAGLMAHSLDCRSFGWGRHKLDCGGGLDPFLRELIACVTVFVMKYIFVGSIVCVPSHDLSSLLFLLLICFARPRLFCRLRNTFVLRQTSESCQACALFSDFGSLVLDHETGFSSSFCAAGLAQQCGVRATCG
jgi:hypothetical protein